MVLPDEPNIHKRLRHLQMSLPRYLLTVFGLAMTGLSLLVVYLWEPPLWLEGWGWRLLTIPAVAAIVTLVVRPYAAQVPLKERTNFWAYEAPNVLLAIVAGVILVGVAANRP